jgi:N-acetylmuramate 1-kinase
LGYSSEVCVLLHVGQARLALNIFPNLDVQSIFETLPNEFILGKPVLRLIAGDASDRKFYRLENSPKKAICMQFPKWEGGYGGDPISWLGMQNWLELAGLPVPRVLHVDEKNCCIWTEDFGDKFLTCFLESIPFSINDKSSQTTIKLYEEAIDLILDAQYPKIKNTPYPALERAFDFEKLYFEMEFFLKYFCASFLKLNSSEYNFNLISEELKHLCVSLGSRPRVLCHRDYHLRNIMVYEGKLKWIDFQDARMGPHTYDLASLVRDSYLAITPKTKKHFFSYYSEALFQKSDNTYKLLKDDLSTEFLLMGLQRNIKALGSFGYLYQVKSKPSYLSYVEQTLQTIVHRDSATDKKINLFETYPNLMGFMAELTEEQTSKIVKERIKEAQLI